MTPWTIPQASSHKPRWSVVVCVLSLILAMIWCGLGTHPLYTRSEGRYATASLEMARGGSWLVPHLDGQPHLTKPPLTYWLEALSIRLFGPTEWAVRAPSALAGSLTLIVVMLAGWKLAGWRRGLLAAGVLSLMPIFLAVSRLTLTDSLLSFFWCLTLIAAYFLTHDTARPRRWRLLLWFAVTLGLLTKGPVILLPLFVVIVWLALGPHRHALSRLQLWWLPVATLPLLAWVWYITRLDPAAPQIWRFELLHRAIGSGDHNEPIWWFVPIFFLGLFPATSMLNIPPFQE